MSTRRRVLIALMGAMLLLSASQSYAQESEPQESRIEKAESYLRKIESWKSDFHKFRDFFASCAQKYDSYSNYSLWTKVMSQIIGAFISAYLNNTKNENASWIVWGVSGALPLGIQAVEKFGGDWQNKSRVYQNLSVKTGELIRRIEIKLIYIRNSIHSDSLARDFLDEVLSSWNEIRREVPVPLKKEDVEGVKNDILLFPRFEWYFDEK